MDEKLTTYRKETVKVNLATWCYRSALLLVALFCVVIGSCRPAFCESVDAVPDYYKMLNKEFRIDSLAVSPDGRHAVVGGITDGGKRNVWDLTRRTLVATLDGANLADRRRGGFVTECLTFSPDGKLLAVGRVWNNAFPGVELWDTSNWKPINRLENPALVTADRNCVKGNSVTVSSVAFSPDGKYLAAAKKDLQGCGGIDLWEVNSGKFLKTIISGVSTYGTTAIGFDKTGRYLVGSKEPYYVEIWEVPSGRLLKLLKSEGDYAKSKITWLNRHNWLFYFTDTKNVVFLADGKQIAVAYQENEIMANRDTYSTGYVVIWNLESGAIERRIVTGPSGWLAKIAVSPNARFFAAAGSKKGTRVIDLETGDLAAQFPEGMDGTNVINAVGFTSDGRSLITGGGKYLWVWKWDANR